MPVKPHYYIADKPLWVGAMAAFPYSEKLYAKLWAEDKYTKEPFNLGKRHGDLLLVPRELAINAHYGKDVRSDGPKVEFAVNCNAPPKNAEQERVFNQSLALLKAGKSHIVQASTGFGKTWLGARLAYTLGLKTLVVVTKEDLMENENQWPGALKRFACVPENKIGIIRQNKCQVVNKLVVIGMVHSLAKEKYPKWIYDEFGLVIFDEVHHMAADTFQIVAGLFNSERRLGLSAGASSKKGQMRSDGKDFVFEAHIGEVAVKAEYIAVPPKVLVLETPWKIPMVPRRVKGEWKSVPLPHDPGKMGHITSLIAKDPARNQMIIDLAIKAWKRGRYVVVFSDLARDKHLNHLHGLLVKEGVPEDDIGFYVGGMKDAEREAAKKKHVILATYGMTAEATDVPWWDTCILATPRSNVKQAIGRILREDEGKQRPIIFDLVDYDSRVCQMYYKSRANLYRSKEINGEVVLSHLTNGQNTVK